jgi:hypothetical protein
MKNPNLSNFDPISSLSYYLIHSSTRVDEYKKMESKVSHYSHILFKSVISPLILFEGGCRILLSATTIPLYLLSPFSENISEIPPFLLQTGKAHGILFLTTLLNL